MRLRLELMQLEMGISTRRYLPARGTAGLERSLVSGNRRVPAPPPMMTAKHCSCWATCVCFATYNRIPFLRAVTAPLYLAALEKGKRQPIRSVEEWRDGAI